MCTEDWNVASWLNNMTGGPWPTHVREGKCQHTSRPRKQTLWPDTSHVWWSLTWYITCLVVNITCLVVNIIRPTLQDNGISKTWITWQVSLDLAREVYWLLTSRCTEGAENASIQVGHENRLFDLIHHVFGCKHHKVRVTRQWYLHTLRANLERG